MDPYNYPIYRWFPAILANATQSVTWIAQQYVRYLETSRDDSSSATAADVLSGEAASDELAARDALAFLRNSVQVHLGIMDVRDDELQVVLDKPIEYAGWILAGIISRRAQTGWSTHGHSGADVNIYASDKDVAHALIGNHENTEVGKFMMNYLNVDVDAITEELKAKGTEWDQAHAAEGSWMGRRPEHGENMDGGSHLERNKENLKARRHVC